MVETDFGFREKLMKVAMTVSVITAVVCMAVMLSYAATKTIITVDENPATVDASLETERTGARWTIDFSKLNKPKEDTLTVFLPMHINVLLSDTNNESDVKVDCRYDTKEVTVTVKNVRDSFFLSNPPKGNYKYIDSVEGVSDGTKTILTFKLNECCECISKASEKGLELKMVPVSEETLPIVMIDPGHGGEQVGVKAGDISEKDVALKIALEVEKLCEDKPYKVLLTRRDDDTIYTQGRIYAIENTEASFYVGIHVASNITDTKAYGMQASYNPDFYHNGLENVDFADRVLRECAIAASDKANGLYPANEDEIILKALNIPATIFYAGHLTNEDEPRLLSSEEYLQRIAKGIVSALDKTIQ